jgi:hypothetical protein
MRKGEERNEKIKEVVWEGEKGRRERGGEEQEERKRRSTTKNIKKEPLFFILVRCLAARVNRLLQIFRDGRHIGSIFGTDRLS